MINLNETQQKQFDTKGYAVLNSGAVHASIKLSGQLLSKSYKVTNSAPKSCLLEMIEKYKNQYATDIYTLNANRVVVEYRPSLSNCIKFEISIKDAKSYGINFYGKYNRIG